MSFTFKQPFEALNDSAAVEKHSAKLQTLRDAVKARPEGKKMSIKKNTPAHQIHNPTWKDKVYRVNVSPFNEILQFVKMQDREGNEVDCAVCEGQVQMGQLSRAALERGLVPKVVPEYTNFTCAGLVNGEGIQSTGFKYGVFHQTLLGMEVMLGDGDVVRCSAFTEDAHYDLFSSMVESYGSLGIVTAVVVELVPAEQYVRSSFQLFDNLSEFVRVFDKVTREQQGDFLEGIVLSKNAYLIIHSRFVRDREHGVNFFDPCPEDLDRGELYYYQYIDQIVAPTKGPNGTKALAFKDDVIPAYSFLFRSMRGAWWMLECHVGATALTNRAWFRRLCDNKAKKQMEEHGGFVLPPSPHWNLETSQRCNVLQDMGVKLCRLEEGIEWVQERLGVYPLWICPTDQRYSVKVSDDALSRKEKPNPKFPIGDPENRWVVDIGIYGEPSVRPFYHRRVLKELAEFVDYPSTWGVSYRSKDEIRAEHTPIRQKYGAEGVFVGVDEKVAYFSENDDLDEDIIFMWRYYREYGPYWWIKVPLVLGVVLGGTGYGLTKLCQAVGSRLFSNKK